MTIAIGFSLQPDEEMMALCEPLLVEDIDFYEVVPESLWWEDECGILRPNPFHRPFEGLASGEGFFVGHGVGLSLGSVSPGDEPRRRRWLEALQSSHRAFGFRWYTDHLGATLLDGRALALPLALPMTDEMSTLVRGRLVELQQVVPEVGLENTVFYYLLGEPLEEPHFLARCLEAPGLHLLLDLHNLFTMALNLGFDPLDYLARLPLERVIEIHVSGGEKSQPNWLGGDTMRLDSHDHAVPEEVWRLLELVLPHCPNLRGVTLERMEGTVTPGDVPLLREELRRVRSLVS